MEVKNKERLNKQKSRELASSWHKTSRTAPPGIVVKVLQ